jgi:predicted transposase/invertase (TIGR01784 family)
MGNILEASYKYKNSEEIAAFLDIILRANSKTFLEVQKMGYPTMEELLTEAGLLPGMIERSRVKGIEQGIEKGTEQGKEIIALNLLKMGMPIAEIAQATELPVEKVKQICS